ncbi:MAG TPA: DUF6263 family protein [Chthonomonadaceae bacterium]|nr:DUF6263 family protein [Chthonomonadaceae bacterium]
MKRMNLLLGLGFGLLAWASIALGHAAPVGQGAQGPLLLRLHMHVNDVHNMRMTANQQITQTINGQEIKLNQTIGMGFRFNVLNVTPDGAASMKITYRSVRFRMEGPQGVMEYDSEHPPATLPPGMQGFAAMVGQSFTMLITPEGRVLEVKGMDALVQRVLDKSGVPEGPARASMEKMLKQTFGEEGFKEMMGQMVGIYPSQPVNIGDTWMQHVALTRGFPLVMDTQYKLTGRSQGLAQVAVQSAIKSNPQAEPLEFGPVKVKLDLSGEQNGTMEIAEATGWMRRGTLHQKLSGTMNGAQEGTTISGQMALEGTTTITSD